MKSDIFDRYLDETLNEAECDELLRQIDVQPALLDELLQQVRMDAVLNEVLTDRDRVSELYVSDQSRFLDTLDRLSQLSRDASPLPGRMPASGRGERQKALTPFKAERKAPVLLLIALLLCSFVWIGLSILEMTGKTWEQLTGKAVVEKKEATVLATIRETSDPVWGRDTVAYRRGEPLPLGPMTLLSGLFSMRLSDGTRIIVNGGTEFSIDSQDKISCRSGKMTFQVPPRTEKLTVNLPQCDVVVLGTKFGIETSVLHSDIFLMEGRIMLTGFHDDPARTEYVEPGETVRIDSRSKTDRVSSESKRWTSFEEMRRLDRESLDREALRWKSSRENRPEDSTLLFALDFEDHSSPKTSDFSILPSLIGGKRTEGRFPGKQAMLFSDAQDRIELEGAIDIGELTLTASIRPDRFDESSSTLFFSQKNVKGAAFWQILSDGQIVFGGANQNRSRSFRSPVRLVREQLGSWMHLAIVIDPGQRRVTHYFNGRQVGTERIDEPLQIRIDGATIGRRPDDTQRRSFTGCMDEFRIYRRSLKADEIHAIVEGYR